MCSEEHVSTQVLRVMAVTPLWLSLTDLGRIYGISAIHCGRSLEQQGWRDRRGRPTPTALEAGAAMNAGPHGQGRSVLWNRTVCGTHLEAQGYEPMSRSLLVDQWTRLLEALDLGSPSINATADQMAEDMPRELVEEVKRHERGLGHHLTGGCRGAAAPG